MSRASISPFDHITWLGIGCSCGGADRERVDVSSAALSLHDSEHKLMKQTCFPSLSLICGFPHTEETERRRQLEVVIMQR